MLVGRPGLSPVMIGRRAELDRLAELPGADEAPAVALVGGEAGVGKTRLVRELLDRLPGARVIAGQADPGSLGRPFSLVLDAIREDPSHEEQLAVVVDDERPMDERVAAAEEVFADLSSGQPTVIVFDDLHWADAPSAAVFERLAEPGSGPALLLATYRPDAMSRRQPAAQMIPRLERRRAVTHLQLERLAIKEVMDFLAAVYGRAPSYRVAETLHARTGGNPYFLEELLSASIGADPDQLVAQPLPWSLGELVRGQLDEFAPNERRILEAAAVLNERVPFDVLASVTGAGEDELIAVLRSLVANGMLVETDEDVFTFRHALARETIEADLLGRERRRLHEQALEALHRAGDRDLGAVAHHARGAGRYEEMVEAARLGARAYLRTGSTYQALQLAELGLSEACDDLDLLSSAARAAWLGGLTEDAVVHAEHLLAVARRQGKRETESAALRQLVRLRWELGDRAAMETCTDGLIEMVDVLPRGHELGNAMACIAQSAMLRERPHEAIEWADRAIALADELDLPVVRVWARNEKGSSMVMLPERAGEGIELLESVADDAEALGEYVIMARALNNQVRTGAFRRDPDDARAILARMQRAAEKVGFDSLAGPGYWEGLAGLAEWDGDLDAAIEVLLEGHSRSSHAMRGHSSWYTHHEAGLALEVGDVDRAAHLFEELPPGIGALAASRYGLAVHIAARRGDLSEVRRVLPDLVAAVGVGGADGQLLHDVTAALLTAGLDVDEVRPLLAEVTRSDGMSVPAADAWGPLLSGQLHEAAADYGDALAGYTAAIAAGQRSLGFAPTGTAHVGAARTLVALGRLDEARAHAEKAGSLLARWSGWRVDELRAVERRLGMGSDVSGPAALTPREREVVALLAEGLTNAELARRLYISPKTASVHVSNILAKLGMTSRAEIAAFAAREEVANAER